MPTGTKPPIPVGTARVAVEGEYGPTKWANVYYMAVGTWDPAHLDDVITLLGSAIHDLYDSAIHLGNFDNGWHLSRTKIGFRDASDSMYKSTYVVDASGTWTGGGEDAQVCYLINWTTNDPRRGGKPRQYISGVIDASQRDVANLDGSFVSGVSGRIQTWLDGLHARSSGTASGVSLLEMSFVNGNAYRSTAHTWPIRAGSFNPVIATQRRRVDRLRST
jgi:hypothetical protein